MKTIHLLSLAAIACLSPLACNQADPMQTDDSTGDVTDDGTGTDTATPAPGAGDFFPLRDGASWTYRRVRSDGTTFDEVVVMREVTFDGAVAYEMEDNAGSDGENTISTIQSRDGQVVRVHKEVLLAGAPVMTVDYAPGFLRFDNGWTEDARTNWMYDRTEFDETGAMAEVELRHQIFTVESMSTSVTVPAGTFDCVQFLRTRADTGEAKRFWFADGVGKVKHESLITGSVEELTEYEIP